jgi:hypothetical protein
MYVYIYIHICVCGCVHVYVDQQRNRARVSVFYVFMHTHMCYLYVYVCVCMSKCCVRTCVSVSCLCTVLPRVSLPYTCMHAQVFEYTESTRNHAFMQTYIIHTYIHTYMKVMNTTKKTHAFLLNRPYTHILPKRLIIHLHVHTHTHTHTHTNACIQPVEEEDSSNLYAEEDRKRQDQAVRFSNKIVFRPFNVFLDIWCVHF